MNTVITEFASKNAAKIATKVGLNSKRASLLADISLFLTGLAMTPYDKEIMQLIPPHWTPYIIKVGMLAQIALRFLKMALQRMENAEAVQTPVQPTPAPVATP